MYIIQLKLNDQKLINIMNQLNMIYILQIHEVGIIIVYMLNFVFPKFWINILHHKSTDNKNNIIVPNKFIPYIKYNNTS